MRETKMDRHGHREKKEKALTLRELESCRERKQEHGKSQTSTLSTSLFSVLDSTKEKEQKKQAKRQQYRKPLTTNTYK